MAIEMVDLPSKNGDVPLLCKPLPEAISNISPKLDIYQAL